MSKFEIFGDEAGGWSWRLLDENGGTALAVAAAARDDLDACNADVRHFKAAQQDAAGFRRNRDGDRGWTWTLATPSREVFAESGAAYPSREECEQRFLVALVAARAARVEVRGTPEPPPSPTPGPPIVPPALDRSVATALPTATAFLYEGPDAVQTGVVDGAIDKERVAVIRGRVLDRDSGKPAAGVTVRVADHPELGRTLTRDTGEWDLAVNGGEQVALRFECEGCLTATRVLEVPRQQFVSAPDVALVRPQPPAGTVDLAADAQQASGVSETGDHDGRRRSLLIAPANAAARPLTGEATDAVTSLDVRVTEFSVGALGAAAMPAALPPSSAYTYAVELAADETGAPVELSEPFVHHVENFLGFPVGGPVPVGYYDRSQLTWVPSADGRVIAILGVDDGLAQLDVDGSGSAADESALEELGVTERERRHLAATFEKGTQLWRVTIPHFSPWDYNWPFGPPEGAKPPDTPPPDDDEPDPESCPFGGSELDVQNQALGEAIALPGTPYELRYRSDRVPGRKAAFRLDIPLTGATVPPDVRRVDLEVTVAGQKAVASREPAPGQSHAFAWDGRDAYGRRLQGQQRATARVGFVYKATYQEPAEFGETFARLSGTPIEGSPTREEVTLWRESEHLLGVWEAAALQLGGWTLDVHHTYDPSAGVVHLGTGERLRLGDLGATISTAAGMVDEDAEPQGDGALATDFDLGHATGVALDAAGNVYVTETSSHSVVQVDRAGLARRLTAASGGEFAGDGGPASKAMMWEPSDVAVGPRGELYVADTNNHRVRRIEMGATPAIDTFAGTGAPGGAGDGGPARAAELDAPKSVACAPDGTVYVADSGNGRVRRIAVDGTISTFAGGGEETTGRATDVDLQEPTGLAVGPDGSVYIAESFGARIRRVTPDGLLTTIAGTGDFPEDEAPSGDGALAVVVAIRPTDLAVASDGTVLFAESGENRVRRVGTDGVITTLAGDGRDETDGDGGPPQKAAVNGPKDVAIAADGRLFIAEASGGRLRVVTPGIAGFKLGDHLIPSRDESELYRFDAAGRHHATLDALTAREKRRFGYDDGRLTSVAEWSGETTRIEHDADGVAVVGPYGHRTRGTRGPGGYLAEVVDPAGAATRLTYADGGLLASLTVGDGPAKRFAYDDAGRLAREDSPHGGSTALGAREHGAGRSVVALSASGHEALQSVAPGRDGETVRERRCCGTTPTRLRTRSDGTRIVEQPDGSTVTTRRAGSQIADGPARIQTATVTPGERRSVQTVEVVRHGGVGRTTRLETALDRDGRVQRLVDDLAARESTATSATGRTERVRWDERGLLVETSRPGAAPIVAEHDAAGRVTSVTAGPRRRTLEWGADGGLAAVAEAGLDRVSFVYEAARLSERREADGTSIGFSYDDAGRLVAVRDASGGRHVLERTPGGLLARYRAPGEAEGAGVAFEHTPEGQLRRAAYADGRAVEVDRDDAGAIRAVAAGDRSIEYQRDGAQRIVRATAGAQDVAREYDGPLLTTTTWSGPVEGTVERLWDDTMRPAGYRVGEDFEATLTYDDDELLVAAGDLEIERDLASGRAVRTVVRGVEERYTYDALGELADHLVAIDGEEAYRFTYARDGAGRVVEVRERGPDGSRRSTFAYDGRGQLVAANVDGVTERYGYDANGNRVFVERDGQRVAAAYDAQDRLVRLGDVDYEHASDGSRSRAKGPERETTYAYDLLGALHATRGAAAVEYVVDGFGRRVGRRTDGSLDAGWLYLDDLRVAAQLDGDGRPVAHFVHGTRPLLPDLVVREDGTYRLVADHRGSPVLAIDVATGEVAQRLRYSAFGEILDDTRPGFQPFGFTGALHDAQTGFVRLGARDYDPRSGRWTAKDPSLPLAVHPNLYRYAHNDPVNFVDPTGAREVICPPPGHPVWTDPPWSPNPMDTHDRAIEKEHALFPNAGHAYSGGFAHCVGACLAYTWYGPLLGALIMEGFDWTQRGDADLRYDKIAERLGAAAAMMGMSCTQSCARHFPPEGCGGQGPWPMRGNPPGI